MKTWFTRHDLWLTLDTENISGSHLVERKAVNLTEVSLLQKSKRQQGIHVADTSNTRSGNLIEQSEKLHIMLQLENCPSRMTGKFKVVKNIFLLKSVKSST
jgi:hypothetical protein